MTLVSAIIQKALREVNAIAIGTSPTADELDENLYRLQNLVSAVYGNEVGENFVPWPLGNYGRNEQCKMWLSEQQLRYPVINSTLVAVNEEAITVNLPVTPSDGSRIQIIDPYSRLASVPVTLNGNGRTIESAATLILNTNGLNRTWVFQAENGNWARITDLDVTSALPFPREFEDYFIIMLAMRLSPAYEIAMSKESLQRLKQQKTQMVARYAQSAPLQINPEISFPTLQSYNNFADSWYGAVNQQDFNLGGYWGWWGGFGN